MVPLIRLCLRGVLLSPVHCNSSTLISAFKRSPSATLEGCQVSSALLTCRATDGPRTYLWSRQQGAVPEGWGSAPAQHCSTAVQDLLSGFSEPCTLQLQEWGSYTGRIPIETCTHTLMTRFFSTALRKKSSNSSITGSTSNDCCSAQPQKNKNRDQNQKTDPNRHPY